jgi:Protein of unknown function (DUF3551)
MRLLPVFVGCGALALAALAAPAAAQSNYPWCSNFADGAGVNCGFSSYEQCMATARGSGGSCAKNDWYRAPAAGEPAPHQARKSRGKNS